MVERKFSLPEQIPPSSESSDRLNQATASSNLEFNLIPTSLVTHYLATETVQAITAISGYHQLARRLREKALAKIDGSIPQDSEELLERSAEFEGLEERKREELTQLLVSINGAMTIDKAKYRPGEDGGIGSLTIEVGKNGEASEITLPQQHDMPAILTSDDLKKLIAPIIQGVSKAYNGGNVIEVIAQLYRENIMLHSRLQQATLELEKQKLKANLDITGVLNQRAFEEYTRIAIADFNRSEVAPGDNALTLVKFDLDNFKIVNSEYGHPIGDLLLQSCAQSIDAALHRGPDVVGRIGGDEFAALLYRSRPRGAARLIERLLAQIPQDAIDRALTQLDGVEDADITEDNHDFLNGLVCFIDENARVTASAGLAAIRPGMSYEEWLFNADQAQRLAKAKGKNSVEIWNKNTGATLRRINAAKQTGQKGLQKSA